MRDFSIDLVWAKVQGAITVIGGWLGYFLGGMDGLMIALVIFGKVSRNQDGTQMTQIKRMTTDKEKKNNL